jgi:hypothetical protein
MVIYLENLHSRLPFKTKYRERLKGDTSTDSMLFSRFSLEPVPMKQPVCTETRRELLNTGYSDLPLMDFPACWREATPDAQHGSLLLSWQNCAKISVVPPESWDTTKTCGMVCCCLITLPKIIPYRLVSGNARGSSISLALVSRDLAARLAKLILSSRKPLKKLLPANARPYRTALVRGRSPFPTSQQSDKDVGAKGAAASRTLAFSPSQRRLLWGTQLENRATSYPGSSHFQRSDLWRLCPLSSRIYSRQNLSYSGQRQMAQVKRSQRFLRGQSRPLGIHLSASLFSRTQSNRTGLENHSPNDNPQPLFPFAGRTSHRLDFSIFDLGSSKLCS